MTNFLCHRLRNLAIEMDRTKRNNEASLVTEAILELERLASLIDALVDAVPNQAE